MVEAIKSTKKNTEIAPQFQLRFANQVLNVLDMSKCSDVDQAWSKVDKQMELGQVDPEDFYEMINKQQQVLERKLAREEQGDQSSSQYSGPEAASSQMQHSIASSSIQSSEDELSHRNQSKITASLDVLLDKSADPVEYDPISHPHSDQPKKSGELRYSPAQPVFGTVIHEAGAHRPDESVKEEEECKHRQVADGSYEADEEIKKEEEAPRQAPNDARLIRIDEEPVRRMVYDQIECVAVAVPGLQFQPIERNPEHPLIKDGQEQGDDDDLVPSSPISLRSNECDEDADTRFPQPRLSTLIEANADLKQFKQINVAAVKERHFFKDN